MRIVTPAAIVARLESGRSLTSHPRAGFWARFVAIVIDRFVLLIPSLVLWNLENGELLVVGMDAAYYVVLNGLGQTVGKRAVGIRVVDSRTGSSIGILRGVVRYLVSIVSAAALLLGYLWMLWDSENQTWHDKAARDLVVSLT